MLVIKKKNFRAPIGGFESDCSRTFQSGDENKPRPGLVSLNRLYSVTCLRWQKDCMNAVMTKKNESKGKLNEIFYQCNGFGNKSSKFLKFFYLFTFGFSPYSFRCKIKTRISDCA